MPPVPPVPWAAELTELLRRLVPNIAEMHTTLTPVHWSDGQEGYTFVATIKVDDALNYAAAVHHVGPGAAEPEAMALWAQNVAAAIGTDFGRDQAPDCRVVS